MVHRASRGDDSPVKTTFRILVSVLVLGLVVTGIAGHGVDAHAHSGLETSEPADGATLDASPEVVTLTFTEEPDPSLARVQLVDQSGRLIPDTTTEGVPGDPHSIQVVTGELPEGAYTVIWRVVSRIDGHATAGLVSFGVGVPPLEVPPARATRAAEEQPVSPLEVSGRWILLVGLVLLLGTTTIGARVFPTLPAAVRRAMVLALLIAVAGLAVLAVAQRDAAQVGLAAFLETATGRGVLWRGIALIVVTIGVVLCVTSRGRTAGPFVAAIGTGGAMLAEVASGHAGSATLAWAEVAAQWGHVAAVGVWIGGLAALLLGIRGTTDATKASAVRRFSRVGGIALVAVIVTGTIRAFDELDAIGDLFSTSYGQILLVKLGALGGLVALGAVNRYRNVPRAAEGLGGLRKVSRAELILATGVLAASAILTGLAPPTASPVRAATTRVPSLELAGSDFATSIRVLLKVSPGGAGTNRFDARITDYDSGQPVPASRVALGFTYVEDTATGRSSLELAPQQPGTYSAIGPNLALEGLWHLILTVERSNDSTQVAFDLATRCRAFQLGTGRPQVFSLPVEGVGSVQGLVGGIGGTRYEVHFTFLDERDRELDIRDQATILAWQPGAGLTELRVTRLGRGHFVGHAQLDGGRWFFQATAITSDGAPLRGCFEEEI
jgi:copper transport protein